MNATDNSTPRTDAAEFFLPSEAANTTVPATDHGCVDSAFARQLERELAEAKARDKHVEQRVIEICADRSTLRQQLAQMEKERDEARASYRARDNIGMSREEYHKAKKALEENETLQAHLASERQAKIERGDMFLELQNQYEAAESELAELRKFEAYVQKFGDYRKSFARNQQEGRG